MKGFIVISVAILFLASLAGVTNAALDYTLRGKVVSVDPMNQVLTVIEAKPATPLDIQGNREYSFTLGDMTFVKMCNQYRTVGDLKAGNDVTVRYHEEAGRLYADTISIPAPLVACLLEQ